MEDQKLLLKVEKVRRVEEEELGGKYKQRYRIKLRVTSENGQAIESITIIAGEPIMSIGERWVLAPQAINQKLGDGSGERV